MVPGSRSLELRDGLHFPFHARTEHSAMKYRKVADEEEKKIQEKIERLFALFPLVS